MSPDVVPDRVESKINIKVIILIISLIIAFQYSLFLLAGEDEQDLVISYVSIINPAAATAASFVVARRYRGSETFGRSYFLLACGFLSVTIAEVLYYVYDIILNIEAYPSVADIFFFALYPFVLAHIIINIRFFNSKIPWRQFWWVALISVGIISVYVNLSLEQLVETDFDFYYGMVFVIGPAVVLPFTILAVKIFKGGVIGSAWHILLIAVGVLTAGDVWYYHLEIFDQYSLMHPVNMFWYIGYWFVVYALYKHQKEI